jgi:flagellar hook-length control protein FliK
MSLSPLLALGPPATDAGRAPRSSSPSAGRSRATASEPSGTQAAASSRKGKGVTAQTLDAQQAGPTDTSDFAAALAHRLQSADTADGDAPHDPHGHERHGTAMELDLDTTRAATDTAVDVAALGLQPLATRHVDTAAAHSQGAARATNRGAAASLGGLGRLGSGGEADSRDTGQPATAGDKDPGWPTDPLWRSAVAGEAPALGSPSPSAAGQRRAGPTSPEALSAQDWRFTARHAAERTSVEAQANALRESTVRDSASSAPVLAAAATAASEAPGPFWATGPNSASPVVSTTTPTPTTYTAQLPQAPGSAAWQQALGQQLIFMSQAQLGQAELQLNPLALGPLKVSLQLIEGGLMAQFSAEHPAVREAVQAALPQLRTTLAEQGLSLGQTQVGADTRGSAQEREQAQQGRSARASQPPPASPAAPLNPATALTPATLGRLRTWA